MKYLKALLITLLYMCTASLYTAQSERTIIFDLGDTLIITDDMAATRAIGLKKLIRYAVTNLKTPARLLILPDYIQKRLFTVFDKIQPRDPNETSTYAPNGLLLPQLMCSWMKGTVSNTDTLNLVYHQLKAHPEYCDSKAERTLILAMAHMTFTPTIFANTRTIAPGALELIRACKSRGDHILVLSNWDAESFTLVKQRFPELFQYVDGIVISGKQEPKDGVHATGILKPDLAAYQAVLAYKSLKPADCIFIDDRPENIDAACDSGMQAILCPLKSKKPDLKHVHAVLANMPYNSAISCNVA